MIKYTLLTVFILGLTGLFAQQTPGANQNETISITGATLHLGNGQVIEKGTLVFSDGVLSEIGNADDVQAKGNVIEAAGKHVYPGFILANSSLGLGEIDAVRATRDFDELGSYLPHVRSLIAYNAESKVVESMRPNGILMAQIAPRGGRISGTSSIVQLDAWNWEDAAVKTDDGLHMNWPNTYQTKYFSFGSVRISGANEDYQKQVIELRDYLNQARAYGEISTPKERNLPFEAMQGVFSGNTRFYIHAKREKEIRDALDLVEEFKIENAVLVGGHEAYKVMDLIKKHNIPVIVSRVHSLPLQEDDDYDRPYKNAAELFRNGILVTLENSGQMERMNGRNLPFYAGTVSSFGLSDEEALSLITLNPAKILGIDDRYGSLEKGKSATLFISDGNPLDMRTNNLTRAFIDGREISLETHQTELWKRYMGKFEATSD
ncbi:MAG: amidohydrolase family protein [Lutimonas sp.]